MKHLLLLSTILFVAATLWVLARNGRQKHLSISLHVAQTRRTCIVFGVAAAVATALAAMTIFGWLLPHYEAGLFAYIIHGVLIADFFLVAFVPHIAGTWRGKVHNFAAWGMAYAVPVAMALALMWPLHTIARAITAVLLVLNLILLGCITFKREKYLPVFLYLQSAYLSAFFLSLVALIYL